ncbi:MAG: pyridoxal phosphate-dependent aminotransferase [bacterium]|nr:pyridoxal phosphate-dependent aminotransferase [bacterium]
MKNFAKRARGIKVSTIREMSALASKVPGVVSLGQGIPSFDLPRVVQKKLAEALKSKKDINKYSLDSGMTELKEEIAKDLRKRYGKRINPEKELIITKGAMGAIFCAISALVERGEEVIILTPAYESHIELVKFAEAKPVFVPLIEKENWKPDIEGIKNKITKKTKAIIICDPSNPTGNCFSEEDLKEIARLALDHNLYIVTDETYDYLTYEGKPHFSLLSFPRIKDRLVACFSFSKKYAMTGFRVGYVVAQKEISEEILKVHDESTICAATVSQYTALFSMKLLGNFVEQSKRDFTRRKELICERLDRLPLLFEYQKPMGAYYVFPKIKLPIKSMDFSKKLLYEAKVASIPGVAFGPGGENHVRFSFAGTEKEINTAFDRIEKYSKKLLKQ